MDEHPERIWGTERGECEDDTRELGAGRERNLEQVTDESHAGQQKNLRLYRSQPKVSIRPGLATRMGRRRRPIDDGVWGGTPPRVGKA